jgi:hypothetical protein
VVFFIFENRTEVLSKGDVIGKLNNYFISSKQAEIQNKIIKNEDNTDGRDFQETKNP